MNYPDKTETLALLEKWERRHNQIDAMMDSIEDAIGIDINGAMFGYVWGLFDDYTATLAALVGDLGEWLQWYSAENEMGKAKRQAGYDKNLKPIKNLSDLWLLIEESRSR